MTFPRLAGSVRGREVRISACGAGSKRGRREREESRETWALAVTEASPRMARLVNENLLENVPGIRHGGKLTNPLCQAGDY